MKPNLCLLLPLALAACNSTATPRPEIAILSTDLSATDVQHTRVVQITATAQRLTFNASATALAYEQAASVTRSASDALATRAAMTATMQALQGTQIALDRASLQATATAEMWPAAAHATSEALYNQAQNEQESANGKAFLWLVIKGLAGLAAVVVGAPTLSRVGTWCWHWWEEERHNAEENLILEDHGRLNNDGLRNSVAPQPPPPDETLSLINAKLWRTRLGLFMAAGDRRGFSNSSLCNDVVSNENWGLITNHLIDVAHVLQRDTRDRNRTKWAEGWNLDRAREGLRSGALPLPTFAPVTVNFSGNGGRVTDLETQVTVEMAEGS